MKKLLATTLLVLCGMYGSTCFCQTDNNYYIEAPALNRVMINATFPGGTNALYKYVGQHLVYPPKARDLGIEGKVIVGFYIDVRGRTYNIQILRSLDPECDAEVIKLIKNMPAWTPAKEGNIPVSSYQTLPVVFKMEW